MVPTDMVFPLGRWGTILFTGETCFYLTRADGRVCVHRCHCDGYAQTCLQQVDSFGGGIVIVWA